MWENIGQIIVNVVLGFIVGAGVWLTIRGKAKKVIEAGREILDVAEAFIDSTDKDSPEGVKFSPEEWANFMEEIAEAGAAIKEITKD